MFGGPSAGTVVQLNRSGGGVPKLPLPVVDVDWGGVVGDVQVNRRHHGRPFQALCLWDADVIDRFASEGHPIGYGSAGENVTIRGVDWGRVRPGVRLRPRHGPVRGVVVRGPVLTERGWFVGRAFNLMHHDRGPVSRMYATVLQPGRIATGDDAVLEP